MLKSQKMNDSLLIGCVQISVTALRSQDQPSYGAHGNADFANGHVTCAAGVRRNGSARGSRGGLTFSCC